ncbi:hypothetical protein [Bradyrhizobium jicamae]|uniref:hypothetical protein n=1 Tax=Bradyrhizobium jicamae TaxID=280332 RepID=UPI001BA7C654|nr:hypothetical protein [Bradyrhizobium jicamae]
MVIGVATGGVFDLSVSGVTLQLETGGLIVSLLGGEPAKAAPLSKPTTPKPTTPKAPLTLIASRRRLRTAPSLRRGGPIFPALRTTIRSRLENFS